MEGHNMAPSHAHGKAILIIQVAKGKGDYEPNKEYIEYRPEILLYVGKYQSIHNGHIANDERMEIEDNVHYSD